MEKMYLPTYVSNEDSNQPAHLCSPLSLFYLRIEATSMAIQNAVTEYSDRIVNAQTDLNLCYVYFF